MAEHGAEILWERAENEDFLTQRYSRRHSICFDGGAAITGSSSPHVVPLPWSDASAIDPEEAFVASLASCHMLWFLSLAAEQGWCVDRYADAARGLLQKNPEGNMAITRVTLRPEVRFSGAQLPTRGQIDALHHQAHERCFIANSVKTDVRCEPVYLLA